MRQNSIGSPEDLFFFSRRSSGALYPDQIIICMKVMLSLAEFSPSLSLSLSLQCFMLASIASMMGTYKHGLVSQLRQRMGSVLVVTVTVTVVVMHKLKNVLKHVMFLLAWVRMQLQMVLGLRDATCHWSLAVNSGERL